MSDAGGGTLRILVLAAEGAPLGAAVTAALGGRSDVALLGPSADRQDPATIRSSGVDLLIAAGYERFVGRELREAPRLGALGLHPSLLPAYRGSHPLWWALRNGERTVGLTLYALDAGIDTGPVLLQREVATAGDDTFATLYARVCREAGPLLDALLDAVRDSGTLPASRPQPEAGASRYPAPGRPVRAVFKAWWALRPIVLRRGGRGGAWVDR